ncbi:MAG: hypothetical protein JHD02_11920 [Thermoleophilaceae bacterium]|nr:hypothetical protein [Thermoleophilaceae bacterium]
MLTVVDRRSSAVALIVFLVALLAFFAGSANAASVAYLDAKEVWVSSPDGSKRARLSGGEGDWTAVAQSDLGYIVGVQIEAGKISQLSRFTVWDPAGNQVRFGALGASSAGSMAYPLSLNISPDGGLITYGFSELIYGFPVGTLNHGFFVKASADATIGEPVRVYGGEYPTLVGTRAIVATGDTSIGLQDPSSPASAVFAPWITLNDPGYTVRRTDASPNGQTLATEVENTSGPNTLRKIYMIRTGGLGAPPIDDCLLDVDTQAIEPSIGPDGTEFAWQDAGGVKVAGVPSFNGAPSCALTRAPVTVSSTGSYPSMGPFNVDALLSKQVAATFPVITAPGALKISKLLSKKGAQITIASTIGGPAAFKLTVTPKSVGKRGKKPITIASGKTTLTANVAKNVFLKLNKVGKKLKKKLKRKKATLTVTAGGRTTTTKIKLK